MIHPSDFAKAPVDPLAKETLNILSHMNEKYHATLHLLCKSYGDLEVEKFSAFIYFVDRRGFNVLAAAGEQEWVSFRIPFPHEMTSADECLRALGGAMNELLRLEQE